MSDLGHEALRDPVYTQLESCDTSDQASLMGDLNIGLVSLGGADAELNLAIEEARALGWTPFRWQNIIGTVVDTIANEGIQLPSGRSASKERGRVIDGLLGRFDYSMDGGPEDDVQIFFTGSDGEKRSVCQDNHLTDKEVADAVRGLSDDPSIGNLIFGKILQHVGTYVRGQKGIVLGESRVGQIDTGGRPHFLVESSASGRAASPSTRHDDIIHTGNPKQVRKELESSVRRHASLLARRDRLEEMAAEHEITVIPAFTFDNWPTDPLMTQLRSSVGKLTEQFLADKDVLCDDRDLKYQTLFRLTTYGLPEIFENGKGIEEHMLAIGAFRNWRNILRVGEEQTDGLVLNQDLVGQVQSEQLEIIQRRLARSTLPLEVLLARDGMFGESGWFIQKKNGDVHAVRDGGVTYTRLTQNHLIKQGRICKLDFSRAASGTHAVACV